MLTTLSKEVFVINIFQSVVADGVSAGGMLTRPFFSFVLHCMDLNTW